MGYTMLWDSSKKGELETMTNPKQPPLIVLVPILSPEPLRPTVDQVDHTDLLAGFRPPEPDAPRLALTEEARRP